MVPVLLQLGPITIYTFGAMMALGFLVAGYVVSVELARKGHDPEDAWSIVLWAAVGGIVGARLLAILTEWRVFLEHPLASLFSGSGFVWYGGLIGGFVSVTLYVLRRGIPWLAATDCVAPGLAIGQAIGRIGCQVAGDGDWGTPTTLPWGMQYPNAIVGWSAWLHDNGLPPETRVHPAPVYETLAYSAIFALIWTLRKRKMKDGAMMGVYLAASSVARFLVECVRVEPVLAAGLSQAQWIAVPLFAAGLAILAWRSGPAEAAR